MPRSRRPPELPELFIDRGLGHYLLPDAMRLLDLVDLEREGHPSITFRVEVASVGITTEDDDVEAALPTMFGGCPV